MAHLAIEGVVVDGGFGVLMLLFMLVSMILSIAATGFWIWMIIEVVSKEPDVGDDKRLMWILIVVLAGAIGAAVYYFVRRPERIQQYGQ